MPKTIRITLEQVTEWHNVARALQRTCRGKLRKKNVHAVLSSAEQNIQQVRQALRQGQLPVGAFKPFVIHDPKRRVIHAASLHDRIAHHALMHCLGPVFERVLLPSVFACRPGKGVHAAIAYAQHQFRRYPWVMHLDIAHYFPAIDHVILRSQICRRIRGDSLHLVDAVIAAHNAQTGKGLPIGALTSQHFANHYLNDADRWCLAQPEIAAHCRYMDDFLLWSNARQKLVAFRSRFIRYLHERLALTIKQPLIERCEKGILFCGIHIKPYSLRSSKRRRRRYRQALEYWENCWRHGLINSYQLQQMYASTHAILLPANDAYWRRCCGQNRFKIDA